MKPLTVLALSAAIALFSFTGGVAWAEELKGKAGVIDGDTFEIAGRRISLFGIDAFESDQPCFPSTGRPIKCGYLALMALKRIIEMQEVACKGDAVDEDGDLIAVCHVAWLNIGEQMVAEGWAMADPKTGKDYLRAEHFAKARKEGAWRVPFDPPWEWRKAHPR